MLKPIEENVLSHEEELLEVGTLPSQLQYHYPNRKGSGWLVVKVPRLLKPTQDADNSLHNSTRVHALAFHYSS